MISRCSTRALKRVYRPQKPTSPRPSKPQERRVALVEDALLRITINGVAVVYKLEEIPADFCRAWRLTKPDGEVYHVSISPDGETCDCKGGCYAEHCKHAAALQKLVSLGMI